MLQRVDVGNQSISSYVTSVGADAIEQLQQLAAPLKGLRVLQLNATSYGGGVAEILRSKTPLLRDLGIDADWRIITGDADFFNVTKKIHNGLQGSTLELTADEKAIYLENSEKNARLFEQDYDLVSVHDPQPLALPRFHGRGRSKWVWRCHIDTSYPNPQVWEFLRPFVADYDVAVFTLGGFVPPDFPIDRIDIIPPAIDPESPKNIELDRHLARRLLQWIGIEVDRPFITQVSRFDPWKDPLGVIAAYRLVKSEIPDLQLALVGSMALDDPEGWVIYQQILDAIADDPGIHVFTNLTGVSNVEVNAFQRLSSVVIQKSIREGFGLVISEALWKETPVVAGRAGGIPIQMPNGAGGFLIDSVEECADRILWLFEHPDDAKAMARSGREVVRQRFLLPRLLADELRVYCSLLGLTPVETPAIAQVGLMSELRDPVCGRQVTRETALMGEYRNTYYYFCSPSCRNLFHSRPRDFVHDRATPLPLEPESKTETKTV